MSRWYPKTVSERLDIGTAPPNESGCRIWQKAIADTGYGVMNVAGKIVGVHRLAYERAYGPIPKGMLVLHSCDVRPCIELEHLRVGTYRENVQDAMSRDRIVAGDRHALTKISEADVHEAVSLVRQGRSQREVAALFGVARHTISQIMSGAKRSHAFRFPPAGVAA